jgi:large subunit ribosomal protein L15
MQLHDVHKGIHKRKLRKRVGRGTGSGHGKTASKGHKGHASRQGFKLNPLFEGGQMPLARRVPKRGFCNGAFKKHYAIVNLASLDACFEAGTVIDETALRARGLVKGRYDDGVKILGDGAVTKAFTVHAAKFSTSAASKIAATGGTAVVA